MHDGTEAIAGTWAGVLERTWLRPADQHFFRFSEVPSEERDGGLSVVYDRDLDVVLSGSAAARALQDVVVALCESHVSAVTPSDLSVHVMRHAAAIKRTNVGDPSWEGLVREVENWASTSVVAVPLGGIFSSSPHPIQFDQCLLAAHLSREAEEAIAKMAVRHGLHGFRFTATWWTEVFLAAEGDGAIAAELAQEEEGNGTWQPLVLAIALPAAGVLASYRAVCLAEALLGALVAMQDAQPAWRRPMPWILGQATFAENPRSPTLNDDGSLPTAPIQVDALPGHGLHGYAPMEHGRPSPDLDLAVAIEDSRTSAVMTRIALASKESDDSDSRLIMACRLAFAATLHPPDIGSALMGQATNMLRQLGTLTPHDQAAVGRADPEGAEQLQATFRDLLTSACTSR